MNEFTEVTAENLRFVRGAKGMNQEEVAELLGLQKTNVSNIETGRRTLSASEKTVLDWYFFGTMPPRLASPLDLQFPDVLRSSPPPPVAGIDSAAFG